LSSKKNAAGRNGSASTVSGRGAGDCEIVTASENTSERFVREENRYVGRKTRSGSAENRRREENRAPLLPGTVWLGWLGME